MYTKKLYQELASLVQARRNCVATNNGEWRDNHEKTIFALCKNFMPSGGGVDCGTKIDLDASTGERLVFDTGYHHMNENGYYDEWTTHRIIVKPSLLFGLDIRITGRDRNQIKEHLHEIVHADLTQEIFSTRDEDGEIDWKSTRYADYVPTLTNGAGI